MLASVLLKEDREWAQVEVFHSSSVMWFTIKPFLFLVPVLTFFIAPWNSSQICLLWALLYSQGCSGFIFIFLLPISGGFRVGGKVNACVWLAILKQNYSALYYMWFLIFLCCRHHGKECPFFFLIFILIFVHTAWLVILVPRPGIEPAPSAVKTQRPNHWTAREFPNVF